MVLLGTAGKAEKLNRTCTCHIPRLTDDFANGIGHWLFLCETHALLAIFFANGMSQWRFFANGNRLAIGTCGDVRLEAPAGPRQPQRHDDVAEPISWLSFPSGHSACRVALSLLQAKLREVELIAWDRRRATRASAGRPCFGRMFANLLKRRRPQPGDQWSWAKCSSASAANSTVCGASSTLTEMSSTSWSRTGAARPRPGGSTAS